MLHIYTFYYQRFLCKKN